MFRGETRGTASRMGFERERRLFTSPHCRDSLRHSTRHIPRPQSLVARHPEAQFLRPARPFGWTHVDDSAISAKSLNGLPDVARMGRQLFEPACLTVCW